MISEPDRFVDEFIDAGCDSITFHVEVEPERIEPTLRRIRAAGRAAGLAVKPATPLTALEPYRRLLDIVMVMTVEPGFGGQAFLRDVAKEKVLAARDYLSHKPVDAEVHVDGGVNRETAELAGGLGADILVVGSVLWIKGRDMAREIRLVRALADEGYQYQLNDGVPPSPRGRWVRFTALPWRFARRFMDEIEVGDVPVVLLRGDGRINPDGVRDYEMLVPIEAEALVIERHAAARERYAEEAEAWRASFLPAAAPDPSADAADAADPVAATDAAAGDAASG
jgi:ribulose-phosphate 3-epimerase